MSRSSIVAALAAHLNVLVAALLCIAMTGCATPKMEAPAGTAHLMTLAAQGVQSYECRAAPGAAPAWAFTGPQADLFGIDGRRIGRHGAGPSWQHEDGSGFTGSVRTRQDAPRPGAIPWLLLDAKALGPAGAFSSVSAVQRVDTVGGLAPDGGCDATTLGRRVHIAYRADYVLFVPAQLGGHAPAQATQQLALWPYGDLP